MNDDCLQSLINLDRISCGWSKREEQNFHFAIEFQKYCIFLLNQDKSTV